MEDWSQHPVNLGFGAEQKVEMLRVMVRIRRFDQAALKQYILGKGAGFLLQSIGQESIAASVRSLMGPEDHGLSGPRGSGHAIAAGMAMGPMMAEHYGKLGGCSKGKGGMWSFYAPDRNHWGCHGLAAAHTPLAAGLAFALKQREIPGAVVCFLGDGAVNQGVYHESLNLAGLFGLPVVYLIENNGYSMGTSVARSSRFKECLARRAESYDIDWDKMGDRNIYELRARVWIALERARRQQRPTVLEVDTYRYYGFHIADASSKRYRTVEEIEARKARDPLDLWRRYLIGSGVLDEESTDVIDKQAKKEAEEAVKYAEESAPPGVEDILQDVYWESDHGTEASKIGRHFFGE